MFRFVTFLFGLCFDLVPRGWQVLNDSSVTATRKDFRFRFDFDSLTSVFAVRRGWVKCSPGGQLALLRARAHLVRMSECGEG